MMAFAGLMTAGRTRPKAQDLHNHAPARNRMQVVLRSGNLTLLMHLNKGSSTVIRRSSVHGFVGNVTLKRSLWQRFWEVFR